MNEPFSIGALVRILPPFSADLPGVYTATDVIHHDDGQTAVILGDLGGFDPKYLESAE